MENTPLYESENDKYSNNTMIGRIDNTKKSKPKDHENNSENVEAALAIGLLDLILEYPAELENFTRSEISSFYKSSFGSGGKGPDQETLDFLVEHNILLYQSESERYCLNHSNHLVAVRSMENDERSLDNNANLRISHLFKN